MPKGTTKKSPQVHKFSLSELAEAEITPEERAELIAETAYYRAQSRGFEENGQLRDWFEAEKLVDEMLHKATINPVDVYH